MKHLTEQQLIAQAMEFGEPRAVGHLAGCEDCRARLAGWRHTLAAARALEVPATPPLWADLAPRLDSAPAAQPPRLRMHVWAPAAAVFACAVALWLLRPLSPPAAPAPTPSVSATGSVPQPSRLLRAAVAEHFDRTQVLLLELAHAHKAQSPTVNLSREKALARQLATTNELYLQSATLGGDRSIAQLLGALQPPLLEIAHSPERIPAPRWQQLQHRVSSSGLLFKLRIVGPYLQPHGAL